MQETFTYFCARKCLHILRTWFNYATQQSAAIWRKSIICLWINKFIHKQTSFHHKRSKTITRSSATAEKQRVSYARLSRLAQWSYISLNTASVDCCTTIIIDKCKKTVVYIHLNGDMQWLTHRKQQKSLKMWYYPSSHRLTVNVLLNNITFLMIFAVFDVWVTACRR